jgi:uncharacterized protein YjbI with pentapeptide repeats
MRTEAIDKENLALVEWDENYFKYCDFADFSMEGGLICSDFVSCSFNNVDWYWGLFSGTNFVSCRFTDCVFRGSTFADSRFVECKFANCRFIKDNLDRGCVFTRTTAFGCMVDGGEGFDVDIRA